jgi:threonine synthase
MINVSNPEILEAMCYTGRLSGIFAKPASATAVAGVRRAVGEGLLPESGVKAPIFMLATV